MFGKDFQGTPLDPQVFRRIQERRLNTMDMSGLLNGWDQDLYMRRLTGITEDVWEEFPDGPQQDRCKQKYDRIHRKYGWQIVNYPRLEKNHPGVKTYGYKTVLKRDITFPLYTGIPQPTRDHLGSRINMAELVEQQVRDFEAQTEKYTRELGGNVSHSLLAVRHSV